MALGLNSYSLILSEFGHSCGKGGFNLILPKIFLLFHHSSFFSHYLGKPHHFAPRCVETFERWADYVGLYLELQHLPTLQLGLVRWDSLNMIGLSCKAYSQLRHQLPLPLNARMKVGDIPLHHTALLRNEQGCSCYTNRLVKEGWTTVSDLLHSPWKLGLVPPLFQSSYSEHAQRFSRAVSHSMDFHYSSRLPKTLFPIILASQETSGRQPVEVWRAFNKLILPHSSKQFIRESLWPKLVGDKLKTWLPGQRHCRLCGEMETIPRALFNCKFILLASDTISKCLSTHVHQISHHHLQTLSTQQGLLLWAATQANWSVRSSVRLSNRSVNASHFVKGWAHLLQPWSEPFGLSMNRSEVLKFLTVLQGFLETG